MFEFLIWYIKMWKKPTKEWTVLEFGDMAFISVFLTVILSGLVIFVILIVKTI